MTTPTTSSAPAASDVPEVVSPEKNWWDRQPGEPVEQYRAFMHYLQQGPGRQFAKTEKQFQTNWRHQQRWRWQERADAFDDSLLAAEVGKLEEARKKANDKQLEVGGFMLDLGRGIVLHYLNQLEAGEIPKLQDAARIIEVGAKLQRLALGEPTEAIHKTSKTLEVFVAEIHQKTSNSKRVTD